MVELIAKRYTKALISGRTLEHMATINQQLQALSSAYCNEKFCNIIESLDISTYSKVDLLLSFNQHNDYLINNLLILLGTNRRLEIIPAIAREFEKQYYALTNQYQGIIYSNIQLSDSYIVEIQNKLAAKFGVDLRLTNIESDYNGIKVDIDGLGVEVGFERNKFKSQMIEHILKAV